MTLVYCFVTRVLFCVKKDHDDTGYATPLRVGPPGLALHRSLMGYV